MKNYFVIFLFGMSFAISGNLIAKDSTVLRFSTSTSWGMPYGKFENEHMTGGLIYDLAHAIAAKTKRQPEFIVLPRNRMDLGARNNEYDIRCHVSPKWVKDRSAYQWSDPLFETSDYLVGHIDSPKIKLLAELKGQKIGTVLGYIYPTVESHFKNRSIEREDAESQKAVLQKLANARTSYAISNALAYEYFLKMSNMKDRFADWKMKISTSKFYCAVVKHGHFDSKYLIKTINKLKKDGTINYILNKYR